MTKFASSRPKWILVHGTKFKNECIVWTGQDEEEMPIFALLKEICIVEQNLKNVWLLTEELLTISHNKHFNAFEVELKPNQELALLKQDDL